jgi:hypothetical protein
MKVQNLRGVAGESKELQKVELICNAMRKRLEELNE